LFSSQKDDLQRTELVLAITPRILRNAPKLDVSQTELWVGTEQATRLRLSPDRENIAQLAANVNLGLNTNSAVLNPSNASSLGLQPMLQGQGSGGQLPFEASPKTKLPSGQLGVISASFKGPKEVKVGDVFAVSLQISSTGELLGLPMEIGFPIDKVEILDVSEGNFFKKVNGTNSFIQSVNAATGRIGIGILRSEGIGVSGEGEVVKVQLKAKTAEPVEIVLTSLKPMSTEGAMTVVDLPKIKVDVK
jgi:general secretion pathway protein D